MKQNFPRAATLGALAFGILLTACATPHPYTGDKETSKTTKGAVIGAATGAVAGVISGDDSRERRKRALVGAGVGALAGGAVGYYMDPQEAQLREQLVNTGVQVVRQGDHIVLSMPGNITFATDSADLNSSFYSVLDSVALVLNEYDQTLTACVLDQPFFSASTLMRQNRRLPTLYTPSLPTGICVFGSVMRTPSLLTAPCSMSRRASEVPSTDPDFVRTYTIPSIGVADVTTVTLRFSGVSRFLCRAMNSACARSAAALS